MDCVTELAMGSHCYWANRALYWSNRMAFYKGCALDYPKKDHMRIRYHGLASIAREAWINAMNERNKAFMAAMVG